ncbi:hypothetical protein VXJ25_08965 [Olsenella sp. YH-ols2223]|uniref:Lipoprotein n=1 Tax=Olsenella absiana TaxID=3115222 RepID=A0ABU7RC62_9ACTN
MVIPIVLAASLSLLPLAGCGKAQSAAIAEGGSSSATSSVEKRDIQDFNLTETFSYQGVAFLGDPSWDASADDYEYTVFFDGMTHYSPRHIWVHTALHGQTATLEGAFREYYASVDAPIQTDTWTKDGVTYASGYYETSGGRIYLLSGSDSATGRGFLLNLTIANDGSTEDQQKNLFDKIVATIEYDSSQTNIDYHEAFAKANSSTGDGSSNGTNSSSGTNTSDETTSQTSSESDGTDPQATKQYGTGTYKVGSDLPAGEYKLTCTDTVPAYWAVTNSSAPDAQIVGNDNFTGTTYVTVSDGQYLKLVRCVAEPTGE